MATDELGPGVSRFINDRDRQFAFVIYQFNKPPLDSELNLTGLTELEAKAEVIRSRYPSGWLMNESDPLSDYFTDVNWSNFFFFGRNATGELRNIPWAIVNGWLIPVTGTRTGEPPLSANDTDTHNRIELNPPNTSTGGNRAEFVFLEVWLQRIDVDPPDPAVAPGKPQRGFIYRFGNVESGYSNLPDELVDPDLGFETTQRVQLQYRVRVVPDINLTQNTDGFDPTLVLAQGTLASPSTIPFANMRGELGDSGLWRAGTGDPTTFGTVDGYVYAVPITAIFRRNGAGFVDTGNLAGAFNRNSIAVNRDDNATYTAVPVLPAALNETETLLTFTSLTGTVLATMNSFNEAFFRVDAEIIRVTNIVQVGATFQVSIDRAVLNTVARAHDISTPMNTYTVRPDGLFADQIAKTDILDLRHSVADKFDYEAMLHTNMASLLKSDLRTTWKRFGSANSAGPIILYGDRITDDTVFVGGLSRLDEPDGNRRAFADAIVTERYTAAIRVPLNTDDDPINGALPLVQSVAPYNIQVNWTKSAVGHPGSNFVGPPAGPLREVAANIPSWFNGDEITILLSDFQAGMPASDSDQVRFVVPTEEANAVVIHFEGMTTDPAGGVPNDPATTSPSATNPNLTTPTVGNRILLQGSGLDVTVDGSGNLVIKLASGNEGDSGDPVGDPADPLQEFSDAIADLVTPPDDAAASVWLHIQFSVVRGAGRGLSHRPGFVHTANYRGTPTNTSKILLRPGLTDKNRMIPTYLGESPLVQTGRDRQLARTSEIMVDPGSKSTYVAPYRNVLLNKFLVRDGTELNWFFDPGVMFQGAMPELSQDGATILYTTSQVDPLDRFYDGAESRYVEMPFEYAPHLGLHHLPIVPVTTSVFPSGINWVFMSQEGTVANDSNFNPNIVAYPTGAGRAGFYIATPVVASGEVFGERIGGFETVFGLKYTNSKIKAADGSAFRGIQFPPFTMPARITGIYERDVSGGLPAEPGDLGTPGSPFDGDRVFVGGAGTAPNLLRDDCDAATLLLDVNSDGDPFFVLSQDVIDFSKLTVGTNFDDTEFFVECTIWGADRGWSQTNARVIEVKGAGAGDVAPDTFLSPSDAAIGIITPSPLTTNANNNEVTVYYSRAPYQGDAFGTQDAFSDDPQRLGPLSIGEANAIHDNPVGEAPNVQPSTGCNIGDGGQPTVELALSNPAGFEVLASQSFVTSLGTGGLSGTAPQPLLEQADNPDQVPDFANTLIDVARQFSMNRVGFEDWETPKFPVLDASFATRPDIEINGTSDVFDFDTHINVTGCTTNLPIGAYFRDKDFIGKTLYQVRSTGNKANTNLGSLSHVNWQAPQFYAPQGTSTWEGTEFPSGNSTVIAGAGTEKMIKVDGTDNFSDNTRFKTTRGASGYSASPTHVGGPIASSFPKARPNSNSGAVLVGTAYLIRSQVEDVGGAEIHQGSELQMVIATEAIPAYFHNTELTHSANGTQEGFTAFDRFRCWGHPLEKRRGGVDLNIVPSAKPKFKAQITSNPIEFGSSDQSLLTQEQEFVTVTVAGTTAFTLTKSPEDPTAVLMWLRGVKLTWSVDYTVGGPTNQDVTFIPSGTNPPTLIDDVVEFWYVVL